MTKVTEKLGVAIQYEIPTAIFLEFYDQNTPPKFTDREHSFVPDVRECVAGLAGFPNIEMVLAWPNANAVNLTIYVSHRRTLAIFRLYMHLYLDFGVVWAEFPTRIALSEPIAAKIAEIYSRAIDLTQSLIKV